MLSISQQRVNDMAAGETREIMGLPTSYHMTLYTVTKTLVGYQVGQRVRFFKGPKICKTWGEVLRLIDQRW